MNGCTIIRDPYNIIITGVGGQGNVFASRIMGNILSSKGYHVTIGETFGVSQRGGSVMSHLRVSNTSTWSPQIPAGQADMVVALEPIEAIRVMSSYGSSRVKIISNTRPIYPVSVIAGEASYPGLDEIRAALLRLSNDVTLLHATDEAIRMGNPILGNVIMMGAVAGTGIVPFGKDDFKEMISKTVSAESIEVNIAAFARGMELLGKGLEIEQGKSERGGV